MTADFVFGGSADDPLVVVRSRFWNFNAIGLFRGDAACVVDPGIYPDEIDALSHAVRSRDSTNERHVTHVVVTHSHHDHIRGWMRFPGARVVMPRVAADKDARARERILAAKQKIDEKLGIDDPAFRYPEADEVFDESTVLSIGGLRVEARFLPGHSNCTSVVWVPELATLCTADYLVSPGLPYCRFEARLFESALAELARFCESEGVERIVPAHNAPILGRDAIRAALEEEAAYFRFARGAVRDALGSGASREECVRGVAEKLRDRRGRDLGGMERQDADNVRRLVAEEAG